MDDSQRAMKRLREHHSLTRIAGELGLTRQAVQWWERVPPKHVLMVARITRISRHVLRPDIYGPPRKQSNGRKRDNGSQVSGRTIGDESIRR
jgi:DNA-binding transcriptional regulator YdaS (Cro superfamily)